ncbi:MAG TPA: iron-containing redox enzyme family protein [Streptosporangiaceae bacterium]|jgi:pyrroloquinoline quinone (PQQ) biosynthesis protein C
MCAVADPARFVDDLLSCHDSDLLNARAANPRYRETVANSVRALAKQAFTEQDETALRQAHLALGKMYDWYFSTPLIEQIDTMLSTLLDDIRMVLENAMLAAIIAGIKARTADSSLASLPGGKSFLPWFRRLISEHQASNHSFYRDFLENRASPDDMRFYLAQETSLDPRLDDILALLIMGTDGPEKMELTSNLWDEVGNGNPADAHATVFARTLDAAGVTQPFITSSIMLESRICGNVSAALALSKRHYYKAIGYFGVTEYLTPRRFRSFVIGCKRLNLPEAAYQYHSLHIQIDSRHGPAWFKNVIAPAVIREPRCAHDIALGTLLRLETSTWYLNALQAALDGAR